MPKSLLPYELPTNINVGHMPVILTELQVGKVYLFCQPTLHRAQSKPGEGCKKVIIEDKHKIGPGRFIITFRDASNSNIAYSLDTNMKGGYFFHEILTNGGRRRKTRRRRRVR